MLLTLKKKHYTNTILLFTKHSFGKQTVGFLQFLLLVSGHLSTN